MRQIELAVMVCDGVFTPEVCEWIRTGLRLHIEQGVELDRALALDRGSKLRQAFDALDCLARLLDEGRGDWHLAGKMEGAIDYFRYRHWPRISSGSSIEPTPMNKVLTSLFRTGVRFPRSRRRLLEHLQITDAKAVQRQ